MTLIAENNRPITERLRGQFAVSGLRWIGHIILCVSVYVLCNNTYILNTYFKQRISTFLHGLPDCIENVCVTCIPVVYPRRQVVLCWSEMAFTLRRNRIILATILILLPVIFLIITSDGGHRGKFGLQFYLQYDK